MEATIPSAADLRQRLKQLSHAQMTALAAAASVPFTTLWKIRTGDTDNPRLETVRRVWPRLTAAVADEAATHG